MTDAAHLFSDLVGFFISLFSLWIARRPTTEKYTFGYDRSEVIGALSINLLYFMLNNYLLSKQEISL